METPGGGIGQDFSRDREHIELLAALREELAQGHLRLSTAEAIAALCRHSARMLRPECSVIQ